MPKVIDAATAETMAFTKMPGSAGSLSASMSGCLYELLRGHDPDSKAPRRACKLTLTVEFFEEK